MEWHTIGQYLPDEEREQPEPLAAFLAFADENNYLHITIETSYEDSHGNPMGLDRPETHLEEADPGIEPPYTEIQLRSGSRSHSVQYNFLPGRSEDDTAHYLHEDLRAYELAAELDSQIDRVIVKDLE